jgi:hypothetical protein
MAPHRSPPSNLTPALLDFRKKLQTKPNKRGILSDARIDFHPRFYAHLARWTLLNVPSAFVEPFPRKLQQGYQPRPLRPVNVYREFLWAASYLINFGESIDRFLRLLDTYPVTFLHNDYSACQDTLDRVEKEFGSSLWLIKNRLPLLQTKDGLEAHKQYSSNIVNESPIIGSFEYITHYVSVRNEPSVTPRNFWNNFLRTHEHQTLPPDLAVYLRFHIEPAFSLSQDEIAAVLRHEHCSPVIDFYDTFIRTAQIAASQHYDDLAPILREVLRSLSTVVNDKRIATILALIGEPRVTALDRTSIEISDDFLGGDYGRACERALTAIEVSPEDQGILDTLTRSATTSPISLPDLAPSSSDLLHTIIRQMASVRAKSKSHPDQANQLLKLAINNNSQSWALGLLAIVITERSSNPMESGQGIVQFSLMAAPMMGVLSLRHQSPAVQANYAALCTAAFPTARSTELANALSSSTELPSESVITIDEKLVTACAISFGAMDYRTALERATALSLSNAPYYRQIAIRYATHSLLGLNRIGDCIRLIVDHVLGNFHQQNIVPIEAAYAAFDEATEAELAGSLELPIFFELVARYVQLTDPLDARRRYACEDFLTRNGVGRPSQISCSTDVLDQRKLIYFLRHLCTEAVMGSSLEFRSSGEVTHERLKILQLLATLDQEHVENYQAESKTLHRKLMIQERLREVDQSKIYVDLDSIRKATQTRTLESYNRYVSFLSHDFDVGAFQDIQEALELVSKGSLDAIARLTLPKNEITAIFESIIGELRDEFTIGSKHGLDCYLSTRIRHGTFSAQLRRPLESSGIITERDYRTDEYKRNEHWIRQLNVQDQPIANEIDALLRNFSAEFDRVISRVVNEHLQVRRPGKMDGWFDFTIVAGQVRFLSALVRKDLPFDEFLNSVFLFLMNMLEGNLEKIQEFFDTKLKAELGALVDDLQIAVESLDRDGHLRELTNSIVSMRTELFIVIDRIKDWFSLSHSSGNEPFELLDAVEVAAQSVRTFRPAFRTVVESYSCQEEWRFAGAQLPSLVDVFFIIFDNVSRHSGFGETPTAEIKIEFSESTISVTVTNECRSQVPVPSLVEKVMEIKKAITNSEHLSAISREGGSGFHKITKILEHDLGISGGLDFGFEPDGRFVTSLALPYRISDR